jgi:hypothetical protein
MVEEVRWEPVADVLASLAGDEAMAREVVEAVRGEVPEIAALDTEDVVEHATAFVTAGLEAMRARRPPTQDELAFIENLAATRARQGVPITAMMAGLYAGQRVVWAHATEHFRRRQMAVETVTALLVAHLGWTYAVQERAIGAHRRAELEAARRERDARGELLRALVSGPVRPHHATEALAAGFSRVERLWLVFAPIGEAASWPPGLVPQEVTLSAGIGTELVALAQDPPREHGGIAVPAAVVGPVDLVSVPDAARLALRTLRAAQRKGQPGLHRPADVAVDIIMGEEEGLGSELGRDWLAGLPRRERYARSLVETLLTHLDRGESLEATARALYVHPNTVRYRLQRLQELTGLVLPTDMNARVRLWWAATAWLQATEPV